MGDRQCPIEREYGCLGRSGPGGRGQGPCDHDRHRAAPAGPTRCRGAHGRELSA